MNGEVWFAQDSLAELWYSYDVYGIFLVESGRRGKVSTC